MNSPAKNQARETRGLFLKQEPEGGGMAAFFAAMLLIFLIAGTLVTAISRLP